MDLIERLRAVAARTNDPLLLEAADALEAARVDGEDAARYRWLRDSPGRPCRVPCAYAVMPGDVEHPTPIGGATLDAAIDHARAADGGG